MAIELWASLKQAITTYTGLSPATFFTVVAMSLAFYYVVSGLFGASSGPTHNQERSMEFEPLPPPVQVGEITEEELKQYDGADPKKPLLMAIKGQIYDVTQSRMFYGPGGPYALFAGKDASRALAKMSFEEQDLTSDISGLGPFELEALQDWEYKFMGKYTKVGTVKKEVLVTDGSSTAEPTEAAEATNREAPHVGENASLEKPEGEPIETAKADDAEKKDE